MNKFMIVSLLVGGLVSQNNFGEAATFTNYCIDKNGETIKSDKPCSQIGLKEQQFATGLKSPVRKGLVRSSIVLQEDDMHTLPYME